MRASTSGAANGDAIIARTKLSSRIEPVSRDRMAVRAAELAKSARPATLQETKTALKEETNPDVKIDAVKRTFS
jgi:hypothetical protein